MEKLEASDELIVLRDEIRAKQTLLERMLQRRIIEACPHKVGDVVEIWEMMIVGPTVFGRHEKAQTKARVLEVNGWWTGHIERSVTADLHWVVVCEPVDTWMDGATEKKRCTEVSFREPVEYAEG